MLLINNITNDPSQTLTLVGENQEQITLHLYYKPTQQGWFYDISYKNFTANGLKMVGSINTLRQWKSSIPFGLACISKDGYDPWFLDDFQSGRMSLYLLNADDVKQIELDVFTFNESLQEQLSEQGQEFYLLLMSGFYLALTDGFLLRL